MDTHAAGRPSLWIEIKYPTNFYSRALADATTGAFVNLLAERAWQADIVVQATDGYTLSRLKASYSSLRTLLAWAPNSNPQSTCLTAVSEAVQRQVDILSLPVPQLDQTIAEECIRQAKQSGLQVAAWTIDSPRSFMSVLASGVDSILTDFPACMAALLGRDPPQNPYPDVLADGEYLPKCGS